MHVITLHMIKANCNKKKASIFVLYIENNVRIILQLITVSFDSDDPYWPGLFCVLIDGLGG